LAELTASVQDSSIAGTDLCQMSERICVFASLCAEWLAVVFFKWFEAEICPECGFYCRLYRIKQNSVDARDVS